LTTDGGLNKISTAVNLPKTWGLHRGAREAKAFALYRGLLKNPNLLVQGKKIATQPEGAVSSNSVTASNAVHANWRPSPAIYNNPEEIEKLKV
jgi:hypothetical protein